MFKNSKSQKWSNSLSEDHNQYYMVLIMSANIMIFYVALITL